MVEIIKLENIETDGFDRNTGKPMEKIIEEYVCEACRHLVNKDDKFCRQCGAKLEPSSRVEHYFEGKKLTNKEFNDKRLNLLKENIIQ